MSAAALAADKVRPRRLLHVFSTFAVGGPQVRFAQIANRFGRRYEHIVIAMDGAYGCAERLAPALRVSLPCPPVAKKATLANAVRFRRLLGQFQPDLLVTYNWGATEWGLANLLPVCRHLHVEDGFGPDEKDGQLLRRVLFRRLALARAGRIVLPSRTLHRIARYDWGFADSRLAHIPNGIDCARFVHDGRAQLRRRLGLRDDALLIGTVAALRPEKNLTRLIVAFALAAVPDAVLVIAGDGPERRKLQAEAERLGVAECVYFLGHVAEPEVVICGLDLFALSSDTEQMPYGVMEAMAAGLAVAGTDVGDVRAMVADDNGRFVNACTAEALARSLTALLGDGELRRRLGQANRRKAVVDFDQERMFTAWDGLFSQ